jgi:hypothetical protein
MTKDVLNAIRKDLPKGFLTIQDEQILYSFSRDRNILEIGTAFGRSAALMSFKAESVTTIDIFELDDYCEEVKNNLFNYYGEVKNNLSKYKNIKVIKGVSYDVVKTLEMNFFDFLFIDGNHEYKEVIRDFEVFYPIIKKDGYILFHDYHDIHPEVVEAVDFINLKYNLEDLELNKCVEETIIKGFKKL